MSTPGEPESNPYESPHANQMHRRGNASRFVLAGRAVLSFVLATAFGAGVWALSPALFGKDEPWDASLPVYLLSMAIGGFILAAICPRLFWVPVAGIYIGQVTYCIAVMGSHAAVAILLLISLAIFAVPPALAGAVSLFAISCFWSWSRRNDQPTR